MEKKFDESFLDAGGSGVFRTYRENGTIRTETPFINHQVNGVVKNCQSDNKSDCVYKADKMLSKKYYYNGVLIIDMTARDGLPDGTVCRYYAGGALQSRTPYENGARNGIQETFYENCALHTEISYKNGVKDGESKTYAENGGLIQTAFFSRGKRAEPFCPAETPFTPEEYEIPPLTDACIQIERASDGLLWEEMFVQGEIKKPEPGSLFSFTPENSLTKRYIGGLLCLRRERRANWRLQSEIFDEYGNLGFKDKTGVYSRNYYPDGTMKEELLFKGCSRLDFNLLENIDGRMVISRAYFPNGVLSREKIYEDQNKLVKERHFDQNGKPVNP